LLRSPTALPALLLLALLPPGSLGLTVMKKRQALRDAPSSSSAVDALAVAAVVPATTCFTHSTLAFASAAAAAAAGGMATTAAAAAAVADTSPLLFRLNAPPAPARAFAPSPPPAAVNKDSFAVAVVVVVVVGIPWVGRRKHDRVRFTGSKDKCRRSHFVRSVLDEESRECSP